MKILTKKKKKKLRGKELMKDNDGNTNVKKFFNLNYYNINFY